MRGTPAARPGNRPRSAGERAHGVHRLSIDARLGVARLIDPRGARLHVQQSHSREPGDGDVDLIHRYIEDTRDPSYVGSEAREPSELENRWMVPLRKRPRGVARELAKLACRPRLGRGSLELHVLCDHRWREREPRADPLDGARGEPTTTPQELRECGMIELEVSGERTE